MKRNPIYHSPLKAALVVAVTALPQSGGYAAQDRDRNPAPYDVAVDLNYEINIPKILRFQVGSPGAIIDEVQIDLSQTAYPDASDQPYTPGTPTPGDGTPIAATNNGSLTVRVQANTGTVMISAGVSSPAGLGNGAGQFIPFDQILTSSDNGGLPAPVLTNSGAAAVPVTGNLFSGLVTNQTADWTYSYKNTVTPAAGTFTGQVTYTANIP